MREQLMLSMRQTVERIDCNEIYFMESRGHNVYIYTKSGEVRVCRKLADIAPQLPKYFYQCHKSYVINLQKVNRFERTQLRLTDGRIVPISRIHQSEIKKIYGWYLEGCRSFR